MLIEKLQEFTYKAYTELLNHLKRKYTILPFCKVAEKHLPYLILRHDIDASLEAALRMARIEHDHGVQSSYFALFSHRLYNLHEKESVECLRLISGLGHEVGLHYDTDTYESYGRNMKETLEVEVKLLEHILKKRVTTIACHNVSLMANSDPLANSSKYVDVYDHRLYDDYVSDSCRSWFLEDLSRLLSLKSDRTHLLIHPILWGKNIQQRDAVLEDLFGKIRRRNEKYKSEWIAVWHASPKVQEYDALVKAREPRI